MRVRVRGYTNKSPFLTIEVLKPLLKKRKVIYMPKANSEAHTKWLCKYHIVFTPKYRRKKFTEGHLMPDHVHMLVSIPPKISVASFMGYLKGKSSFIMFDRHANLKYKFGNRHFWAEEYYVSTVGLNDATVKKYIRDQESQRL